MNLDHLRRFVAVAETLNFRQGAKRLGISQPPLSRSIVQLEEALGVRLLDRGTRGVSLTLAGRTLLAESARLLEHANLVERMTQRSTQSERLNVGFVSGVLHIPLPLRQFRARWPGVEVRTEELASGAQYEKMLNGELDVGFVVFDENPRPNLAVKVMERSRLALAIPSGWPQAKRKSIALAELADVPMVMAGRGANPPFLSAFELRCRAAGFSPNIAHQANQVFSILKLVAFGAGIGLVPETASAHEVQGVRLVPIADDAFELTMTLAMIWMEGKLSPAVRSFVQMVGDVADERKGKKTAA